MKALIAAVLLVPCLASAQSPRDDRAIETAPGSETAAEKRDDRLRVEIIEFKREVQDAASDVSDSAKEKYRTLAAKTDELENKAVAAADAGARAWRESRHNFKNELRKLRRELKSIRDDRDVPTGAEAEEKIPSRDATYPPPGPKAPSDRNLPVEPLNP